MIIKILGTAAAEGVPALFCNCAFCIYARTHQGKEVRRRCSVLINENLVIDLGPDALWNSVSFNISYSQISYILLSHSHFDHTSLHTFLLALSKYRATETVFPQKIMIIGSDYVYNHLLKQLAIANENSEMFWSVFEYKVVHAYDKIQLNKYIIDILPSNHSVDEPCLLYLISDGKKTVFYGTDTRPYAVQELFRSYSDTILDAIISDCTYGNYINSKGRHMGLPDNIRVKQEMETMGLFSNKSLYILTHFSHDSLKPYSEIAREAHKYGMSVAYDGMEICL
ncbi:MAG: phnP [Herbinix sp.]|jgi:phosphoribosyl 1,2-cyclic phosphate phosphodiesterase|nr:phnP [Herbinix sp.]